MKLVQLLAKELKEWPENIEFLAQDSNGIVFGWIGRPEYYDDQWILNGDCHIVGFDVVAIDISDDYKSSLATKLQWQAEREKMNKPKWIRHRGGKCPVKAGAKVVTRYRDGVVSDWCMTRDQDTSEEYLSAIWSHSGGETDIMAYYVEETKDQEIEEVKVADVKLEMMQGDSWATIGRVAPDFGASVFDGGPLPKGEEVKAIDTAKAPTIEYAFGYRDSDPKYLDWKQLGTLTCKLEIDATEATKEIDSLVAKWGQIESPLKWRDEIIELEAYEEEFRREREKLIRKLESEGFKLIDQISCNLDKIDQALEYSVDMSDWRNWQPGDIVECLIVPAKHEGYYLSGINYKIKKIDLDDEGSETEIDVYCGGDMALWCPSSSFSFIRRP